MTRDSANFSSYMDELAELPNNGEQQYNDLMRLMDMILMPSVIDKDLSTPPGSPTDGACYYVASSPTGDWSGQAGNLAQWFDDIERWYFAPVLTGFRIYVQDENTFYHWNGTTLTAGPT